MMLETENPQLDPLASRMTIIQNLLSSFMKSQSDHEKLLSSFMKSQSEHNAAQSAQIGDLTLKMVSPSSDSELGRGRLSSKRSRVDAEIEDIEIDGFEETFPELPKTETPTKSDHQ